MRPILHAAACAALTFLVAACQTVAPPVQEQPPAPPPQPSVPAPPPRPMKIALALGGGGAHGFAHVGVIKGLEARGIRPDILVGTSVGSFVASLYAAGVDGAGLQRMALQFEESSIADWGLPSRGLFKGVALQDFVNRKVEQRTIEQLPRKLAVVATDLSSGEMVVFERGNVGMAVRASSSVPGLFQPVLIGGREYVDGGLVSPVPVRAARKLGADVVIAVDVSRDPSVQATTGTLDIVVQSFAIMEQVIARQELQGADIVLRPALGSSGSTDFSVREAAIAEGERAVKLQGEVIDQLLERVKARIASEAAAPGTP